MTEYIILRRPLVRKGRESLGKRLGEEHDPGQKLKLSVEDLDHKQAAAARRDNDVVELAPSMRTRLLQPNRRGAGVAGGSAWGIQAIGADKSPRSGAGIKVAVLDTGIDPNHAAFHGVTLTRKNFTADGDDDVDGHGSHCAGIIFGRDTNTQRIGVARGITEAIIGKILDDNGRGSSRQIHDGITWAAGEGAHVISLSVGFDFPGEVKDLVDDGWPVDIATSVGLSRLHDNIRIFDAAYSVAQSGVYGVTPLLVAASGNESRRDDDPRFCVTASPPGISCHLKVGALERDGASGSYKVAAFSNSDVDVSAPGVGILSVQAGGALIEFDGTSMACPHVVGVAALWGEWLQDRSKKINSRNLLSYVTARTRLDCIIDYNGKEQADVGNGIVSAPTD